MLNIVVLIFEILYYSLFVKFAKKEGKFYKYLIVFTVSTLIIGFINIENLSAYLIFIITSITLLKYIFKIKTKVYDVVVIAIMLLIKLFIELVIVIIFSNLIESYLIYILFSLIKIIFVYLSKNYLNKIYNKLSIKWNNNNFYIRYGFSLVIIIYVMVAIISLIAKIYSVL